MNRQKGFTTILIIVVIVLLALGGYLLYKQYYKPTIQPQQNVSTSSASSIFSKDLKAGLEKAFK